ncbi:MAG: M20/M25/M40 family metallo-hydrolase [Ardenticatenaceae bacterium]|nr:M20/M25/M40 family metallo-hydrolase [Ardenticatenaceae bacterium]MCB8949727.1 M20/M25/M40 family metallo-hydrolase [Ardenticatenaceae bacterium]
MNLDWDTLLQDCIDFTQRLIQTPSMPFEEAQLAELVAAELQKLNFDQVWIDEIGNVNGRIRGTDPSLGALVLNTHLDHVDPGEPSLWSVPPYSGTIVGDRIVGRGACDIKGPLAVQVYSMAALLRAGVRPRRDVVFTAVVEEEIGGSGAKHWAKNLDYPVDLVVLGEPSDNKIALGHRGIAQMWVQFNGRSVHASVPEKGVNPNYALAQFIQDVQAAKGELSAHELLGATSVTPTIIEVDTKSTNVTPAWARVCLDFRTASESLSSLRAFVQRLVGDQTVLLEDAMCTPPITFPEGNETIYGFYTPHTDEKVQQAQTLIGAGMGREAELSSYQFATDGRHFVPYNLTMIGYAASEESQAHVVDEYISIPKMMESLRGHVELIKNY